LITFIWAEDAAGNIGYQGRLPWHLPADLQHFKDLTIDGTIVMGRKTFASLPRVLPRRQHLVLTHDQTLARQYQQEKRVQVFTSLPALRSYLLAHRDQQIAVIGGVSLFSSLLDLADRLERTKIKATFPADTQMPPIDYQQFHLVKRVDRPADQLNPYPISFLSYQKIKDNLDKIKSK
jgi:dihydrofolate reductase